MSGEVPKTHKKRPKESASHVKDEHKRPSRPSLSQPKSTASRRRASRPALLHRRQSTAPRRRTLPLAADPSKSKEHADATTVATTAALTEGQKSKAGRRHSKMSHRGQEHGHDKLSGVDLSALGIIDPAKEAKRRKHRKAIRAFLADGTVITVVIIAGLVVLASVLAWRQRTRTAMYLSRCVTAECEKYATLMSNAIDEKKLPCDNYYEHVCSIARIHLKSIPSTIERIRLASLKEEATTLLAMKVPETGQSPLQKAAAYLQACESIMNRSNIDEVRTALRKGGIMWPDYVHPSASLIDAIFYMSASLHTTVLFGVEVNYGADGKGPPTVVIGLDKEFTSVLHMMVKQRRTKRILGHFKLTYHNFAPTPELASDTKRFQQLFDDYIEVSNSFKNGTSYEGSATDSEDLVLKPRDIATMAPSTDYKTWDVALWRHFHVTFDDVASVVIRHPGYFKAVFLAYVKFGASKLLDVFGWLCIQSLIQYTSWKLLTSYHFSSEEQALTALRKHCIEDMYGSFRFAINVDHWMSVPESTIKEVRGMADDVWRALQELLGEEQRTLIGSGVAPSRSAYLQALFRHRRLSKSDKVVPFYASVPALTKNPLYDYIAVKNAMATHIRDPQFKDMNLAGQIEHSGSLRGYSLTPRDLRFPWMGPGRLYALALAGLGVRMAATLYYQSLASQHNATATNDANLRQG
ncbi:hypothetical protein HPB50_002090 [Hyalomma asiaticum]|uniref:Uncharacterized protein n=1 Tax=Hyalomma asiaticum TaxID=266040 RepID=A0ACB7RHC6_HYAAI|nr:hypothetical protein HPB50_002090 [Hyalomma asiaticum]